MADYTELDKAILAKLATGPAPFHVLQIALRKEAEAVAKRDSHGNLEGWRAIDRRLQALRKAGKIKPHRTQGWSLA